MANKAKHFIPQGQAALSPYLVVDGAKKAIEFYRVVFGAEVTMTMPAGPDKIGHAELRVGGCLLMLADEHPEQGFRAPSSGGHSGFGLSLYVPDADATVQKAIANGAKVVQPLEDKFYGDRSASIVDPFGHYWTIATH